MGAAVSTREHEVSTMIKRIGIIGAGQMGSGIAHVCAMHGIDVKLNDIDSGRLQQAGSNIDKNLARQVQRGKVTDSDRKPALGRIATGTDMSFFGDCDMVIEAASEDESVKRSIFKQLVPHLSPVALIATNTSSISITRLAANTDRPGKFIGMHFMNPVPVMQLVEV